MLVDKRYLQTTMFLCQDNAANERVPRGTAFLVRYTTRKSDDALYLVTAAHNIESARSSGQPVFVRINRSGGGAHDVELRDYDEWTTSADSDIAVRPAPKELMPGADHDHTPLGRENFVTREIVETRQIGPGDEVFFCGLFSAHPGRIKAQPIVRWGNISMMPREPVKVERADGTTHLIDAYLIEARSWGGQSGSPAFVFFPPDRHLGYLELPMSRGPGTLGAEHLPLLLGVVQGHFNLRQDIAFEEDANVTAHVPVNSGIAVVVPAQRVVALIEDQF
jgi:hypothetical protein